MSSWIVDDEDIYLSERWAWDGAKFRDLTLAAVTCPNCLHFPAFKDVVVGPAPVGASSIETLGRHEDYPATTNVRCNCGMHEKLGCGRTGDIEVKVPAADA